MKKSFAPVKLLEKLLDQFGIFEISLYERRNLWWFKSRQELEFRNAYGGDTSKHLTPRRWNLAQIAAVASSAPGNTVEFGVATGVGSRLIAMSTQLTEGSTSRTHFMFDSFSGLPSPKATDVVSDAPIQWAKGMLAYHEEIAKSNMHGFRYEVIKGFLPMSLEGVELGVLCFAHIDLDLAQATVETLEFCWERMSPGGIIVVDDYGSVSCPGVTQAVDQFLQAYNVRAAHLTTGQAVVVKR